jgi:hypothetical protein
MARGALASVGELNDGGGSGGGLGGSVAVTTVTGCDRHTCHTTAWVLSSAPSVIGSQSHTKPATRGQFIVVLAGEVVGHAVPGRGTNKATFPPPLTTPIWNNGTDVLLNDAAAVARDD